MMGLSNFDQVDKTDVETTIPFFCKIGQTKAELFVMIEPDPHDDGKGTHAHFHSGILYCPKKKIVDLPEPDRCKVTDETCPFWESFGGYQRNPTRRKWLYAQRFIHSFSSIEFYGTQLMTAFLKSKGCKNLEKLPELDFWKIMNFLRIFGQIDKAIHGRLNKIKETRNKLAHNPEAYMEFEEKELFEKDLEAAKLESELLKKLNDLKANS